MRSKTTSITVRELAQIVDGSVLGNGSLKITGVCTLEDPCALHLTFIRTTSSEQVARALTSIPEVAILVSHEVCPKDLPDTRATVISVKDAYGAYLDLLPNFFALAKPSPGIHQSAVIAPGVKLGADVSVGAHCCIEAGAVIGDRTVLRPHVRIYEGAQIGADSTLFSGVVIRHDCIIGDRVTIHDNVVIGADGFGYVPDPKGGIRKVPQVGNVVIADDVEIGAGTCIDRGTIGSTRIGRGTKIDNLVQIGHNTVIGSFCLICAQTGIAGSCTIEDGVIVGGACGIADHCKLVSGVRLGGWCGVTSSLLEPGDYMGFPAVKASEWRRQSVALTRLSRPKTRSDAP